MKSDKTYRELKMAENTFANTFNVFQLSVMYVLYVDQDEEMGIQGENFSKVKLENFNAFLSECDKNMGKEEVENAVQKYKKVGIDFEAYAKSFPFRARLKFAKLKRVKNAELLAYNTNVAIRVMMVMVVTVLKEHYHYKYQELQAFMENVKKFALLYTNGLQNKHVIQYFKQECNLDIVE